MPPCPVRKFLTGKPHLEQSGAGPYAIAYSQCASVDCAQYAPCISSHSGRFHMAVCDKRAFVEMFGPWGRADLKLALAYC